MHKNNSPGAGTTAAGAKEVVSRDHQTNVKRRQSQGARELAQQLAERISDLALHLLGEPTAYGRTVWRWGQRGSLAVHISTERRGRWYSFEEGRGGDALDLVAWKHNSDIAQAMTWARTWLGGAQ